MMDYQLTRANRLRLARVFAPIPRVDISIECVLEDQMGRAFVDSVDDPCAYLLELDGFFCYFGGDVRSAAGRALVEALPSGRMIMSGPPGWEQIIEATFGEQLIKIERYSYRSDTLSLDHLRKLAAANPNTAHVQRVDVALAQSAPAYLEIGGYESVEDFVARGIGYCLMLNSESAGCAYASLVNSSAIEVSIVVAPDQRQKGVATALAAQLLIWCLENHLAPHWDAANEESCGLAEKLGYTKVGTYNAYFLKARAS